MGYHSNSIMANHINIFVQEARSRPQVWGVGSSVEACHISIPGFDIQVIASRNQVAPILTAGFPSSLSSFLYYCFVLLFGLSHLVT